MIAIGLAGYFSYEAHHTESLREGLCSTEISHGGSCMWTAEKEALEKQYDRDGPKYQHDNRIAWGIAAPLVVGGVVLLILGNHVEHEHAQVGVVPTTSGAMAMGSFQF